MPSRPSPTLEQLRRAVDAVSSDGAFWYTDRNLAYQLVRDGVWEAPRKDPAGLFVDVAEAVSAHEAQHGPLPRLIRPHAPIGRIPTEPDLLDYAVRRVLVFDSDRHLLLSALNGLHRKIEVGLVTLDGFPSHVWNRVVRQVVEGTRTSFLLVHDFSRAGMMLEPRFLSRLGAGREGARVRSVGLALEHVERAGLELRTTGQRRRIPDALKLGPLAREKLASGSYAHLEELTPFRFLRWVYSRVARGLDEIGDG